MECLLAFIEISQFQRYLMDHMNQDDVTDLGIDLIEFPLNIPLSEIIANKVNIDNTNNCSDDIQLYEAKVKGHKLFNKYIRTGCEFEINISALDRDELGNMLMDLSQLFVYNITAKDIILLFEKAKSEMYNLLLFSLSRWRQQHDFAQILSLYDCKQAEP